MSDQWEEVHGFRSLSEYQRFNAWLDALLAEGVATEVPVGVRYSSPYFPERWVHHDGTGEVWRLVGPEAPFRGVFLRVASEA